jgi:hypothetical protein
MTLGETIQGWLGSIFGMVTSLGVLFNVGQVMSAKRQAKEAARLAQSATASAAIDARRAQRAAAEASDHAKDAVSAIAENTALTRQIEIATNSMKDALIVSTAKASELEGEKRGRAAEVARQTEVKKDT